MLSHRVLTAVLTGDGSVRQTHLLWRQSVATANSGFTFGAAVISGLGESLRKIEDVPQAFSESSFG